MSKWTIYHNPRCSKSRQALELLRDKGIDPTVVEYLKDPPSAKDLNFIAKHLSSGKTSQLVRVKDDLYKAAPFDLSKTKSIVDHLVKTPKLLERPIIVHNNIVVIARPIENLTNIL